MLKALAFVLSAVVVSGCYKNVAIRPTELPKLNGSSVQSLGRQGNRNVVAITVAHVRAPDGSLVEIEGEFDAVVRTRGNAPATFDHPVESRLEDGSLIVAGGNRDDTEFSLRDVTKVEVTQYDSAKSALGIFGLGVLGAGLGAAIFFGTLAAAGN